jgi:predicted metal-dependent enzyme (double-stranded beta helix superfamily)
MAPSTLVHARHPATRDLLDLARRYARSPDRWPVAPRFDPDARWYQRLAAEESHEAWLLTWLPGQHTDLHDHGQASGAMLVLSGALEEQVAARAGEPLLRARPMRAGDGHAFGPHHVHRVLNLGTEPAVSLHVYSPALTAMTRYQVTAEGLRAAGVDRAGVDW